MTAEKLGRAIQLINSGHSILISSLYRRFPLMLQENIAEEVADDIAR